MKFTEHSMNLHAVTSKPNAVNAHQLLAAEEAVLHICSGWQLVHLAGVLLHMLQVGQRDLQDSTHDSTSSR
jgi:hypothetical protein